MPRYIQKINEDGTSRFVEVGKSDPAATLAIHGTIEPFVSPIDGSVISDRKQYREHCEKHNVVPTAEFSPEFIAKKRAERERMFTGELTRKEKLTRRQEIWEIAHQMERKNG